MSKTTALLITATLLAPVLAAADPNDARAAFERGQSAFKAGRIHEACAAFAESEQLAASVETEQSLARCYEQDGKPASAAKLYRSLAERDPSADRRKTASAKAAKLEAAAPKLRFAINPVPQGLVVKVDGVLVVHTEDVLVDTGPHDVIATAPGYQGHASAPIDREGAILDVILRMEPVEESAPSSAARPQPQKPLPAPRTIQATPGGESAMREQRMPEPERTTGHRRRNGFIVGAVGLGVLAGAGITFALSHDKLSDEHALCPDSQCANDMDLAMANSLVSDARTLRGVSIGMGIGGGLLVAAGTYLVLTGNSAVSVHAEANGAAVAYTARF